MKNLLKKLHIVSSDHDDSDASKGSAGKSPESSSHGKVSPSRSSPSSSPYVEQKLLSGLSGWLNSVTRQNQSSNSTSSARSSSDLISSDAVTPSSSNEVALDLLGRMEAEHVGMSNPLMEEEYQIQLALALSAKEDPEAAQIEAVKQISLGSCPLQNTPAEIVAYRYWNYNALGYDDKILNGFYDLYGILAETTTKEMPSLVDLQGTPLSDDISWEVVLVNREVDMELSKLEERALMLFVESRSESHDKVGRDLIQKLAALVSEYMGGSVADPDSMLRSWKVLRDGLRAANGNMVFHLGSLTVGLARHRALLFKVLADVVGIPCRLAKGRQYTGSDDVAMNVVKIDDGREYIVDLMGAPGTLIPFDALGSQTVHEEAASASESSCKNGDLYVLYTCTGTASSADGRSSYGESKLKPSSGKCILLDSEVRHGSCSGELSAGRIPGISSAEKESSSTSCKSDETKFVLMNPAEPFEVEEELGTVSSIKPSHPYMHARSPSWTEGVSSPAVRRMKIKDVSKYMIDAAKENPQLAQKLHDVLLESGVVAPPNLFSEISTNHLGVQEDSNEERNRKNVIPNIVEADANAGCVLPSLPSLCIPSKAVLARPRLEQRKPVEGLGVFLPFDIKETNAASRCISQSAASGSPVMSVREKLPLKFKNRVPVVAAAATAAVVASSMVVAVSKSSADPNAEVPVATAATATAAAVVATTAAVSCQYEKLDTSSDLAGGALCSNHAHLNSRANEEVDASHTENLHTQDAEVPNTELGNKSTHDDADRGPDQSVGNECSKTDMTLDVAEFEILWEEITLGERIGLGSYGEVYRGDWHGTEVAVKRFLDQDLSGVALEEFKSEVRIMKRLRHPNVVLFMGAVTQAPNLAIVTEFLPRGSLYRLLHRPTNQIDERRRLRMAFDVARGMNYLHNCTPVIVHRDLKSPNLLVDKNWVVKVCDFGLSRIKHSTFLSSRSTSGTAEWMAPEVLRNEPSDEKCDVYSFGVILWELATLQQPWAGMNPMQVVGAVGFQNRRLEISDSMDPAIAEIIRRCWKTDPKLRPSFADIMIALKPLQKPITRLQTSGPTNELSPTGDSSVQHIGA